jgi:maltooligosyltrehalose trehalohydrolase
VTDAPRTDPVRVEQDGDDVTIEVTVAAPVATVWTHLRDPRLISRWHGWDDPGLDEEIDIIYGHGAREADEPYVLETKGGAAPGSFEHGDRFDLREEGGGTVVRITRGPKGIDPDWDAMYDDITQGWVSFLAQLRFVVERHGDLPRRTVFLASGPAPAAARELLGLEGAQVGQPVEVADPAVRGTTWFGTANQAGLVVDAYGPGLVVAYDKPAQEPRPGAVVDQSMVIVSTFGLDDDAFAEVESTWQRWWAAHHASGAEQGAGAPSWPVDGGHAPCGGPWKPCPVHTFTVWSPAASAVDLVLPASGSRVPMSRSRGGWWSSDVEGAGHGTDYWYSLDGADPVPDPRSPWQPDGVHGPSRVLDPAAHRWDDTSWTGTDVRGKVFYELHVGTFTAAGTFDAAVERLDHLVQLGVDVVELMPVAAFPGRWGWGYDGVALYAVHEPYGGPQGLQRFVDACHTRGLAVCLDVVYNHLGPSGNYLHAYGPYFTDKHHTPWGQAVNLDDEGSQEVRRFVVDNALRWFRDFHVDALRLDAVHALVDDSEQHVLAQLADETASLAAELGRPLGLVAESDLNDARMVTPTSQGGLGMTAQWDDDFHHAVHALTTGERQGYYVDFGEQEVLAKVLTSVFLHDGRYSTFRGADWGAPVDRTAVGGHAFLAYTSNHDQVGNRAVGDRPSQNLSPGVLAAAATLTLTSPFTPMLFMGEEWGAATPWLFFTDHAEPELAESIRQGRRREFAEHGWDGHVPDPQDHATRDASVLDWEEIAGQPHQRLLAWHRELLSLRRREDDLRDDRLDRVRVDHDQDAGWVVVHRGVFRVVLNLSTEQRTVPLGATPTATAAAWDGAMLGADSVTLPGPSVAVVRVA